MGNVVFRGIPNFIFGLIFNKKIFTEKEARNLRDVERTRRAKLISPEQISKLVRTSKLREHFSSEQKGFIIIVKE